MTYDDEDQANEQLALTEICGLEEFEIVPHKYIEEFQRTFGPVAANVKGKIALNPILQ